MHIYIYICIFIYAYDMRLDAGYVRRHFLMRDAFFGWHNLWPTMKAKRPLFGSRKATRRKNPCTSIRRSIVVFLLSTPIRKTWRFSAFGFFQMHSGMANYANLAFFLLFRKTFKGGRPAMPEDPRSLVGETCRQTSHVRLLQVPFPPEKTCAHDIMPVMPTT